MAPPPVGRALVTGGSGFVGRHVVDELNRRGYDVVAPRSAEVDLLTPGSAASLVRRVRPTHLLHLAWYVEPGLFWDAEVNRAWVRATEELLEAATGRSLTIGTCAEYDWAADGPFDEQRTPTAPQTLYGQSKLSISGLADVHARLFFLFGPHEPASRFVPSLVGSLLRGEEAQTSGDREVRDYMAIADVAQAIVAVLESDLTGPVNVASGEPTMVGDLARTLARLADRRELLKVGVLPRPANDPDAIVADVTRLRTGAGWRPGVSLEARLSEYVEWLKERSAPGQPASSGL